ncbi:MAG: hypothetical protein ACI9MB_001146 [Verrucomicrobiales bacterium]|jgi:hypothetical protein
MASARTESKGDWRVVESTGHAQTGLPFLTQPEEAVQRLRVPAHHRQKRLDTRSIMRLLRHVVDAQHAIWIDQHIPTELMHVTADLLRLRPLAPQQEILPQSARFQQSPPTGTTHPKLPIDRTIDIEEQRPVQVIVRHVLPRDLL